VGKSGDRGIKSGDRDIKSRDRDKISRMREGKKTTKPTMIFLGFLIKYTDRIITIKNNKQ
jgi:hypothetical protein